MKKSKHKLILISGIFLSGLFLLLALQGVNFGEVLKVLARTNYLFLIPALLSLMVDFTFRSLRWKLLLEPVKKCRFINVMSTLFIGFFANAALPLRAGEVIRVIMIGEKENISKSAALATMVVERTMDLFAVFVLFSLSLLFFPPQQVPSVIDRLWQITGLVLILLIVILYGLMYFRNFTVRALKKILRRLPEKISEKGGKVLNSFILGLDILKKTGRLSIALLLSVASWSANSAAFFFVAQGMGIFEVSLPQSAFVMGVVAAGISIPAAPGFIGTYQYFGSLAMTLLGVAKSTALSFTVLDHALRIAGISAGGLFFLAREHVSVAQLEKKAEKAD